MKKLAILTLALAMGWLYAPALYARGGGSGGKGMKAKDGSTAEAGSASKGKDMKGGHKGSAEKGSHEKQMDKGGHGAGMMSGSTAEGSMGKGMHGHEMKGGGMHGGMMEGSTAQGSMGMHGHGMEGMHGGMMSGGTAQGGMGMHGGMAKGHQKAMGNIHMQMGKEMEKHNERVAKIEQTREMLQAKGNDQAAAEADDLLTKENERHQKVMQRLHDQARSLMQAPASTGEGSTAEPAMPNDAIHGKMRENK